MPFSHLNLKQILIRIERDENILDQLKTQLEISIKDVNELIAKIKA
jgi:hypothetical protein